MRYLLAALLLVASAGLACDREPEPMVMVAKWQVHAPYWSGVVCEFRPKGKYLVITPEYRTEGGQKVNLPPENRVMILVEDFRR